ncbi:MAG: GAF domain-containing protein [Anaerolineae bacterium]|nr:GAF domain-containing protein [Anaerolineae bacterium]
MSLRSSVQARSSGAAIQIGALPDGRSRVAELEVLQRIGRALNSTLDEKEILHLLIEETVDVTPAERGSVFLYDLDQACRLPQAWFGYTPEQADALIGLGQDCAHGIIHRVFDSGQIAVTQNVDLAPDYVQIVPDTCSELTVPIRHGLDVVGVIDLESSEPDAFDEGTQRFVLAIAEQAGVAIGNARRFAEQVAREQAVTWRNEQLRHLLEISRMFGQQHALDDLLDIVVQAIPETVGFNVALLSLVGGNPPLVHRAAAAGIPLADFVSLQQVTQPLDVLERTLKDKYRIGQSYFFPHQQRAEWDDEYTHTVLDDAGNWQEGHWHPDDMLLVPLKDSAGALLGLISVDDPQNGLVPTQDTIQTLELFAHEAALAIENARLLDQTQQHVAELELLQQVGFQVASSLDLTTVLKTIVASALQLVPASDVRIYLYDQLTARFECGTQKSRGDAVSRPMTPPRPDGFTARVVQASEMLVINDALNHELYTRPEAKGWNMHAIAGFPLKRAGEILGVMDVSFFYEHRLTQKELDLLTLLANQAAVSIDNARLYEHAKRRAKHLEALWHINQQLATIRDFDELLSQVVQIIRRYFDYDHINLYLVEAPNGTLILQAHSGQSEVDASQAAHIPADRPKCIIAWVATNNKPLLLEAEMISPVPYPSPMMQLLGTRSELAVPLHIGERVAGVLDVHSYRANALGREDLSVVQSLGAQLSVAFENARLYDELELRVLNRTAELADALKQQALQVDKTRAIVESISDAVIVFDPQGNVVLVNPGVERTFGVSHRQWMNCNLNGFPMPRLASRDINTMRAVFEAVRKAREELAEGKDLVVKTFQVPGRVIAASFASVVLRDLDPLNVVAVFRDITREVEIDRMKSEFIAMTAHELRTPMTSITGYVNLLTTEKSGPINHEQQQFLRIVSSNANRLMTLVNDLLDISKIEGEGLRLNLASESMADIVAEVVVALQQQVEEKGQVLVLDVPTDLPEIQADRDRMIQVVINLVSNASKYTPQGGKVTVKGWCENGHLMLDVRDTGIGISPQDRERLFTRFFRADNAIETQEGGTGLGLVITREIVERHGGRIEVESRLGAGSTFRVVLPLDLSPRLN